MRPRAHIARLLLPACLLVLVVAGCKMEAPSPTRRRANSGQHAASEVEIVPRTPDLALYPCSQCHARMEPDPRPRELTLFHTQKQLAHGPILRWCGWCHVVDDLDQLQLVDGTRLSFDESYRLCGQCHGDRLRDFQNGTHGHSGGSWHERIQRRACTACHDPHAPEPPHFEALPPPQRERGPV